MSGTNCHVSTKWEDTGGNDNPECDATVLLNHDSNDISLQELIENELALRSSSAAAATAAAAAAATTKKLVCDMDPKINESNLLIVADKASSATATVVVNGRCAASPAVVVKSAACKAAASNVTEVDDFDVLYNEVHSSSGDDGLVPPAADVVDEAVVTNGHADLTVGRLLSPDPFDDICKAADPLVATPEVNNFKEASPSLSSSSSSSDSAARGSVVFDSLETSSSNEVAVAVNIPSQPQPEQAQQRQAHSNCVSFELNPRSPTTNSRVVVVDSCSVVTNRCDNDFVPVSEVHIVADDCAVAVASNVAAAVPLAEPKSEPETERLESSSSSSECVLPATQHSADADDRDWVRVGDVTAHPSAPEANSLSRIHGPDAEVAEADVGTPAVVEELRANSSFEPPALVAQEMAIEEAVPESPSDSLVDSRSSEDASKSFIEVDKTSECFVVTDDDSSGRSTEDRMLVTSTPNEVVLLRDEDNFGAITEEMQEMLEKRLLLQTSNGVQCLNETELIEGCSFALLTGCKDVVAEPNTNSVEKKSVKKKKSTSEETTTSTKTKKTKKTKKYEEKENISVNNIATTNGFDDQSFHQIEDNSDELVNVCVRDLKIMYCNEANKTNNGKLAQYEEIPVPASVPIKELTRSFGDLRVVPGPEPPIQINGSKSVSMSDLSFMDSRMFYERKTVRDLKKCADSPSFCNTALVKTMRSGFGKFDQLTKKTVMHVRSSDPAKAQQQFSQNEGSADSGSTCKACSKTVFAMEQIKAERAVWHKNCFRCKTCNKQLTVDVYSSHEGELFCKPHFRDLFKPKVVVEEEKPLKFKKPELIIRENQPMDLPPGVVRASDKPDLGLEELGSLNVKSRYQVFEKQPIEESTDKSPICVKRSPSILSKLAKFQAKGMDVGVSSDIFNGIDYEESSSSDEEPAQNDNVARSSVAKEKPIAFNKMSDVKKTWENGQTARREDRQEERRQERQNIRSRLFQGKQKNMREAYENAVAESERGNVKKDVEIRSEKARTIKEKFEKGEILHDESDEEQHSRKSLIKDEDGDVFEAGISKKSREIFQQMDAAIKTQNNSFSSPSQPTQNGHRSHREVITRQVSNDVIRASDPVEEVTVETADISSRYKFFETYKAPEVKRKAFRITPPREGQLKSESPEREIPKDPNVVRCEEPAVANEDDILKRSNTTAKMLSLFRQLEEVQDVVPDGLKPMKKFTPPPASSGTSSEEESDEESDEPSEASVVLEDVVRASDKTEDEYLKMAQKADKAKALKEKFEKWEPEKMSNNNAINLLDSEQASLDTTKSLRARFESMKTDQSTDKPRPKVNRFVDNSLPGYCDNCLKKVYPLEKVEAGDKVFHRSCFKCKRCSGILRMETFTMNNGHLYCVPHFKQLFITKGNYDEGFGNDQHKAKWPVHTGVAMTNGLH